MFSFLLAFHSLWRWVVLISLLYSIFRAFTRNKNKQEFSSADNSLRHWTATIVHVQLAVGFVLYFKSPTVAYFLNNFGEALKIPDTLFFGLLHILLMTMAAVIITIGSAMSKRKTTDAEKFSTMYKWFLAGLIIILLAIPWPGSPIASRQLIRPF
jgi:FtsH-binding integral membrane protein